MEQKKETKQQEQKTRRPWHQGFYGGIGLVFRQWQAGLSFDSEHELSREPLLMDMLIIKKDKGLKIDNPIGRFFRTYNIMEYKSPSDTLSLNGFYKALAYVNLYKALEETRGAIPPNELTLSLFSFHRPRKLFAALRELGAHIYGEAGIYTVKGFFSLPVQVVVTKELPPGLHLPLRILRPGADKEDVRQFLLERETLTEPGDQNNANAVLQISVAANPELYKELRRELPMSMNEALRYVFSDLYEEGEAKGRAEGEARGRAEGEARGRAEGKAEGEAKARTNIVTVMLRKSEPVSKIVEYTQVSLEKITEIAHSIGVEPVV